MTHAVVDKLPYDRSVRIPADEMTVASISAKKLSSLVNHSAKRNEATILDGAARTELRVGLTQGFAPRLFRIFELFFISERKRVFNIFNFRSERSQQVRFALLQSRAKISGGLSSTREYDCDPLSRIKIITHQSTINVNVLQKYCNVLNSLSRTVLRSLL